MIVVIGTLIGRLDEAGDVQPAGFVASLATSAAKAGSRVQVVAKVGDDPAGDAVLLGLAAAGVGHVATLRDAGRATTVLRDEADDPDGDHEPRDRVDPGGPTLDAADVGLALRYLSDYRVIVVAHGLEPGVVSEAVSATTWSGAHLVIVGCEERAVDGTTPEAALMVIADPDAEGLADRLGLYASGVDSGQDPDTAYAVLTEATT